MELTQAIPRDSGKVRTQWDTMALGSVVSFLDERRRPVKDADRAKMQGSIPYFGASGIIDYVNDYIFDEDLVLLGEDGENILSRNRPLAFKVRGKAWINNHAHVLRPSDRVHIDYLVAVLESLDYAQHNSGTAQPKLTKLTCRALPIPLPDLAEQRVIAVALSDTDDLVGSLERMIAKKRRIKLGAMQELLTGKRRLPGFEGVWNRYPLREVVSRRKDRVDPARSPAEFCVELEHLESGTGRLLSAGHAGPGASHKSVFDESNVLFGKLRAYLKKYWLPERPGVCSTEIWVLVPVADRLTRGFLYQLIQTDDFIEAASTAYGTHMPRSDWAIVGGLEYALPAPAEQHAIAAVLSDMDAEIAALKARLSKARRLKRGMMQQLLTGRIRLV